MPFVYTKTEDGLYKCPSCDKTTARQNTMHYHIKKHEETLPYQCTICQKQFLQAPTLANHVAAKHSQQVHLECPVCPVKSLTKANRIIHYIRIHCKEELGSLETLTCKSCGKVSKSCTAFVYHRGICGPLSDPTKEAVLQTIR
jgi:DNA-directed RNA polymerase subunit RPC12/RpoP